MSDDLMKIVQRYDAKVEALTAERDALAEDYERLIALMKAADRLSICAQTTGGVAGPDAALMAAVEEYAEARLMIYRATEGQSDE